MLNDISGHVGSALAQRHGWTAWSMTTATSWDGGYGCVHADDPDPSSPAPDWPGLEVTTYG